MFQDLGKLNVYTKAHELTLDCYSIIKTYPSEEKYGLVSQITRAAVSIPTNIVEGKARSTQKDYKHFLIISRGSLEELKYLLLLS